MLLAFAPRDFNPNSAAAVAKALRFNVTSIHVHPDFKAINWPTCPEVPRKCPLAIIESVTPNSPAEKAKIRTGDYILDFNGYDHKDVPTDFDISAVSALLNEDARDSVSDPDGIIIEVRSGEGRSNVDVHGRYFSCPRRCC